MSSSGPGTGPQSQLPRGNAARKIVPIVMVPIGAAMLYNYFARGNALKTPAVSGIENAYSAGGAKGTHTVGYGGTPRGNSKDQSLKGNPNDQVGGAETFKTQNNKGQFSMGDEQRGHPDKVKQLWNDAMYGSKDGK